MNYKSLSDLSADVRAGSHRIPTDIDLVVGIPRSGMLAAAVLALHLNLPLADLHGFLAGRVMESGWTRRTGDQATPAHRVQHVLLVDDSINTGHSMQEARAALDLAGLPRRVTPCAVYGTRRAAGPDVLTLETVDQPRIFEWNLMHHSIMSRTCMSIDGVLCASPAGERVVEDDELRKLIRDAPVLNRPTMPVRMLVTGRPERFRPETTEWLQRHDIEFHELRMLSDELATASSPSAATGMFKADEYRASGAALFVEGRCSQARIIAEDGGADVLCYEHHEIHAGRTSLPRSAVHLIRSRSLNHYGSEPLELAGRAYRKLIRVARTRSATTP